MYSKHEIQLAVWRIIKLPRDRTAEAVLRDQILTRERGQGNIHFPCSADHEEVGNRLICGCCFLHINRSGLNHTQYYTWFPIRYVVCWTERGQRNIYRAPMRAKEKHKQTINDKEKGTRIAKYTCQKKIDGGHSIERVWHSASREPSDTLPGSQPCTQTRSIHHIPYSQGFSFH